jgi:hypothetical protein
MTMSELRQPNRTPGIDLPVTPMCEAPIDHPGAWTVADFPMPGDYTIDLTAAHLREIERAIALIKAPHLGLDDLQREHFDVPSLRPVIEEIRHEIGTCCGSGSMCRGCGPCVRTSGTGGVAAVPGRTPSYDWSKLTTNRN